MTWSEFLVNANGLFFRENGRASAGGATHADRSDQSDQIFIRFAGRAHLQSLYILRIVAVVETDVVPCGNFLEERGFADAAAAEQNNGFRRSLRNDGDWISRGMIMKIPVYKMEISKVFSVINRNFRSAKQLNRLLTGDKQTEKLSFFAIKKIFFK